MTSKINHNNIVVSIFKINQTKIRREFWIFKIWTWAWTWISEKLFVRIKRRLFRQLEKSRKRKTENLNFWKKKHESSGLILSQRLKSRSFVWSYDFANKDSPQSTLCWRHHDVIFITFDLRLKKNHCFSLSVIFSRS